MDSFDIVSYKDPYWFEYQVVTMMCLVDYHSFL